MHPRAPTPPLLPYTTLFRSCAPSARRFSEQASVQSLSVAQPSLSGAILRHMKVEEIAEAVAKLPPDQLARFRGWLDRKSTRLNSSHLGISYAVFCLNKKTDE